MDVEVPYVCDFEEGDKVVVTTTVLVVLEEGVPRTDGEGHLTIKILHNELTVMVPARRPWCRWVCAA